MIKSFSGEPIKTSCFHPPALDMLPFDYQYVGRNREGFSTLSLGAAWLALSVQGWLNAEDQQLHAGHRPAPVKEWEVARNLKMERKKQVAAAQKAARALTKQALHAFQEQSEAVHRRCKRDSDLSSCFERAVALDNLELRKHVFARCVLVPDRC